MKAFNRVFEFIWPQWDKLVTILSSAVLIGVLFSFSIATVLPLLKVMMGEEGLHGWVNRSISQNRYGLSFYVPDRVDLSDPNDPEAAYYLQIVDVDEDGLAAKAGLREGDLIIGAGSRLVHKTGEKVPSISLLSELATTVDDVVIVVQFKRINEKGQMDLKVAELACGRKPFYADYAQRLLRFVPKEETRASRKRAVMFIIVLMLVVTVVRCIGRFYQDYTVDKVMNTALAGLREKAFEHAMDIPVGFFATAGSSDTVSRLIRDTSSIGNGIKILFGKALREPLKAVGLIITAFILAPEMTLIFLCGAPMSLFIISKFGRKIKRSTRKSLQNFSQMLGKLKEAIASIGVVKVYNRQSYEVGLFRGINQKLLKQQFRIAKVNALTGPVLEALGMMAGSVCLAFGAHWVYKGTMQASKFFTLLVLLGAMADSVRKVSDVWNKLQQANAAAERVFAVIDEPIEKESAGAVEISDLKERIEFENVVFSYPQTNKKVLDGVSLSVAGGQNVAVVGPNGAGKTTLVSLIPRLYDPDSGRVLIDGQDIRQVRLSSLRSQIGVVTQKMVTFNDTVAANIAYGKPGASRAEVIEAAKRAFVDEFIEPLPDGYETIIGEEGAGLSGGQLQRIVIARAILKNPAILIFDEAMSQVDADSEAKIHKAIEDFMENRTSFVIAHRFSTVIKADLIVVMDAGRIIAQGQHEELVQSCPVYQSLYETQLVKV
jgi:subfamily B ATP-binding cassette protein MsbA